MRIMNELIDVFEDVTANDMTKASHEKKQSPWYRVYNEEKKPQQLISL